MNQDIISRKVKEKINGKLKLSVGENAKLSLNYNDITVEVEGAVVEAAMNQPMDSARIDKQMRKTGNTEFEFDSLDIEVSGNIFMPMQNLNELRRTALEQLEEKILFAYRRVEPESVSYKNCELERTAETILSVYVEEEEQFEEVLLSDVVKRIYLDINARVQAEKAIKKAKECGKEIFLGMPHIFRKNARDVFEKQYDSLVLAGWDGMLVRNYEGYEFLMRHGYEGKIVTDYNVYQFNQYAKAFWNQEGVESTTAPLELNYKELGEVGLENSELVVYGHLPMMVSAQCVKKTTEGCKKQKGRLTIKDRYQKDFVVKNQCDFCYNMIYNTAPVVLTDQKREIQDLNPKAIRLHFTIEDRKAVKNMLRLYEDVFFNNGKEREPDIDFTRGHFKRGIK